ncbi:hypothetical protein I7I51_04540, partial [Histoplasma capsulatum]
IQTTNNENDYQLLGKGPFPGLHHTPSPLCCKQICIHPPNPPAIIIIIATISTNQPDPHNPQSPLVPRALPHPQLRRIRPANGLPPPLLPRLPFLPPRSPRPHPARPPPTPTRHRPRLPRLRPLHLRTRPPHHGLAGRRAGAGGPSGSGEVCGFGGVWRWAVCACVCEGDGGVLAGDGRLVGVRVLAGAGPWWGAADAAEAGISMSRRVLAKVARRWPAGLEGVSDFLDNRGRWVVGTWVVQRWLDRWLDGVEGAEGRSGEVEKVQEGKKSWKTGQTVIATTTPTNDDDDDADADADCSKPSNDKERREQFLQLIFEPFANGSAGFVQETQLLSAGDWGFRFEDVNFHDVLMWHGTADVNSPIRMIRYMAERIPHCVLKEFEGVDHYSLLVGKDGAGRLEAILRELVPAELVRGVC